VRVRLTGRGRTFLVLGVVLVAGAALLGFPDVTRVGALLVLLPLLAVASVWRARPRLEVRRTARPQQLRQGETGQVVLDLRNIGRRTLRQHLAEESLDDALGGPGRILLPRTEPGDVRRAAYEIGGGARGVYRPGPLRITVTDPFGLARAVRTVPPSGEVVVLPHIVRLSESRVRRHGGAGDWPVPHQVARHGEDDVSTRAYQQGDELRRIHWPATAHRAQLMVRQEDQPAQRRAVLILDSRRLAHHGGADGSFDWACSLLASVAVDLDHRGYTLHLVTTETVRSERAGSAMALPEVLRSLALALPEARDLDAVTRATRPVDGDVFVAVVGAYDGDELRPLIRSRRGDTAGIMLVVDRAAAGGTGHTAGGAASEVAEMALTAGWRTRVVAEDRPVGVAWRDVTAAESSRTVALTRGGA